MNSTPVQIPPEKEITITLQAQHWQVVMNAVQELPFRIANPVVQALTLQFSQAIDNQPTPMPRGNGADYEIPQT